MSANPATAETFATYPFATDADTVDLLARSDAGYRHWRNVSISQRCEVLARMAKLLDGETDSLGALITREMGKPIGQARGEVTKTANALRWYVEHGPGFLVDEQTHVGNRTTVRFDPLGPVLSIQPWNFPVWQPMRAAMAIMLAGNSYILKPAPNVVGSALALERLWDQAGLPDGVFTVLNAEPPQVATSIADPTVAALTLTGSVGAGSAVAALAGKHIKKCVLELGGSDAFIVLADADLGAAVQAAVKARFQNNGQVCIAAKRFIVEQPVAAEFTQLLSAATARLRVGDPTEPDTEIGPLARADLRDELHAQVMESLSQGAHLICGGEIPDGLGFYYVPTVLSEVRPGMTAFDDETFGPVAAITHAVDATDAVQLANASAYGLSASIWTRDVEQAHALAGDLEVGSVFINDIPVSDPRIPIGGVKHSGFGRELSHFGVKEFTNAKTVWNRSLSADLS
jgi:succinate-semialdehyde dehydrogenase